MPQKDRKQYTWRINEGQDTINEWMAAQSNINASITKVILHYIDRYGNADVSSYEMQKKLAWELSGVTQPGTKNEKNSEDEKPEQKEHTPSDPSEDHSKHESKDKDITSSNESEEDDAIDYSQVDSDNI